MLNSKHFKTEQELLDWVNKILLGKYVSLLNPNNWIINIQHDQMNGDWVIFYILEK